MQTITVYDHARAGFRVVAGEHKPHKNSAQAVVRVYEDGELRSAASLAYALEPQAVRAQLLRMVPDLDQRVSGPALKRVPVQTLPTATADEASEAMRALTAAIGEAQDNGIECTTCGHHFNERAFYSSTHSAMCANPQEV